MNRSLVVIKTGPGSFKVEWKIPADVEDNFQIFPSNEITQEIDCHTLDAEIDSPWKLKFSRISPPMFYSTSCFVKFKSKEQNYKIQICTKVYSDSRLIEARCFNEKIKQSGWIAELSFHKQDSFFTNPITVLYEFNVVKIRQPDLNAANTKFLADLFKMKLHSDVTFLVDGKEICAHRAILASRCDYFKAMFANEYREKNQMYPIPIEDIELIVFKAILEHIYTQEIPKNLTSIAKGVLVAADMFGLENLVKISEEVLCKDVTVQNCLEMFAFADLYRQERLKELVVEVFRNNVHIIKATEGWAELKQNNPQLLLSLYDKAL